MVDYAALVGLAVSWLDGYRAGFNLCMVWKSHKLIALRIRISYLVTFDGHKGYQNQGWFVKIFN
jgi:hypothetical protein